MKILHTADMHLKKGEPKRLEVFSWLINKAVELEVDYFVVAGDLFESDSDATFLRQQVRKMCATAKCKFLLLPGNHDARSFGPEYDYGDNVIQMIEKPYELLEDRGLTICGVPYEDKKFSESVKDLPRDIDVLIAHGTLYDSSFIFSMLEDQETRYMPIFPADMENVARYVAMGHLHAGCIEVQYGRTRAVYPGSPVAIDSKCVGERHFYILDIDENDMVVQKHDVENAEYWLPKEFFVYPGIEKAVLDRIHGYLRDLDGSRVMPNITVRGYIGEKEKEYLDQLSGIEKSNADRFPNLRINAEIQSWDKLMMNPLVRNFVARTEELEDELRLKVFEITFPVFSKVLK